MGLSWLYTVVFCVHHLDIRWFTVYIISVFADICLLYLYMPGHSINHICASWYTVFIMAVCGGILCVLTTHCICHIKFNHTTLNTSYQSSPSLHTITQSNRRR